MALIICPACGKPISDKAENCIHCGIVLGITNNDITPLKTTELATNGYGKLTFEWKGLWMAANTDIYITLNGQGVGKQKSYSFKDGFSVDTPIISDYANIGIKVGKRLNDNVECNFEKGKNYTCTFSYNRWVGAFTYKVTDDNDNVICKKGLSTGRKIKAVAGWAIIVLALIVNDAIYRAYKKEHNSHSTQTEQISSDTNNEQTAEQITEETANTKTKYVYEFVMGGGTSCDDMPYRLTIDTEEETAQLTVGVYDAYGRLTSEKKTFYGTFLYDYEGNAIIRGFTGADDYDIIISGEKFYWSCSKYIDMKNNYLYMGSDEYNAKNPDYRIKMTLVE